MNLFEMIEEVTQGNPGAMTALGNLMLAKKHVDPMAFGQTMFPIIQCLEYGLKGPQLWGLYKDLCQENVVNVFLVWCGIQLGITSKEEMRVKIDTAYTHSDGQQYLDFIREKLLEKKPDLLKLDYVHERINSISALSDGVAQLMEEMVEFDSKKQAG